MIDFILNVIISVVGNEAFSLGVELVGGFNLKRFGSERIDAPTPEACEAECFVNKDRCSAWTFILGSGSNGLFVCLLA